jgi:ribosomal protein S17
MSENTEQLRTITGRVVSNKMDKTVSVLVERLLSIRCMVNTSSALPSY